MLGLVDIPGVDHGDRQLLADSMVSSIVWILVGNDLAHILRQRLDGSRNLDRQEMLTAPSIDPCPPRENLEKAVISRHMRSDRKTSLCSDRRKHLVQILVRQVRGWGYPVNTERAEIPAKLLVVGVGRIDAKNVDAFGGRELEPGKDRDISARSGVAERLDTTDVIVVGDGENQDFEIESLRDYCLGVRSGVTLGFLPSKRTRIVVGVDLQRTTTKHSTSGLVVVQVLSPSPSVYWTRAPDSLQSVNTPLRQDLMMCSTILPTLRSGGQGLQRPEGWMGHRLRLRTADLILGVRLARLPRCAVGDGSEPDVLAYGGEVGFL